MQILYSNSVFFDDLPDSEIKSTLILAGIFMDGLRGTTLQLVDDFLYGHLIESISHHLLDHVIHFIRSLIGIGVGYLVGLRG